jgi:flagellar protein FliJ
MHQPLVTLLEIAERERDEAQARLLQAEQAARRHTLQLQQLQQYRSEYGSRAPGQAGLAASITLLRSHHDFMQRLEQAMGQQLGLVQSAELRTQQLRQELLAQQTRLAGVQKLLQRRLLDQERMAEQQEQRRSDELALQRHWRRQQDSRMMAL